MSTTQPVINRHYAEATGFLTGTQDQINFYHGLKENAVAVMPDWAVCIFTSRSRRAGLEVGGTPFAVMTILNTTTAVFRVRGMTANDIVSYKCIAMKHSGAGKTTAHAGKLTGTDLVTNGTTTVTSASAGFQTYVKVGDVFVIHEPGNSGAWAININSVYTVISITNDTTLVLSSAPAGAVTQNFTVEGPAAAAVQRTGVGGAMVQVPYNLAALAVYDGGVVTNLDARLPGQEIEVAEIADLAIETGHVAPLAVTNPKVDAGAAIAGSKLSIDLDDGLIGLGADYVITCGSQAITGTAVIATGLTAIVAANVSLRTDPAIASAMWVSQTWAVGNLTAKAWKPTGAAAMDPIIAGTVGPTLDWIAIGTV